MVVPPLKYETFAFAAACLHQRHDMLCLTSGGRGDVIRRKEGHACSLREKTPETRGGGTCDCCCRKPISATPERTGLRERERGGGKEREGKEGKTFKHMESGAIVSVQK